MKRRNRKGNGELRKVPVPKIPINPPVQDTHPAKIITLKKSFWLKSFLKKCPRKKKRIPIKIKMKPFNEL